jgi:hypothetical protein
MINPVTLCFQKWLSDMEAAYDKLSKKEFQQLEDKILREIKFQRKHPRKP